MKCILDHNLVLGIKKRLVGKVKQESYCVLEFKSSLELLEPAFEQGLVFGRGENQHEAFLILDCMI